MKSVTQAAEYLGVSARRVRRLCVEGRVQGAVRQGMGTAGFDNRATGWPCEAGED